MAEWQIVKDGGIIPIRGTSKSAGYDLYSIDEVMMAPHSRELIHTGIACEMADNEYLSIVPRSGLAIKSGITVLNSPGTVDADYFPNEIGVILLNTSDDWFYIKPGDRIAQAILQEYKCTQTDKVANMERGGGYGSTGQ